MQLSKLKNVRSLVNVARKNDLPLRMSEAATISYGGVQGISDTAGAALWALDVALELAYQGAAGIHFHRERAGRAATRRAPDACARLLPLQPARPLHSPPPSLPQPPEVLNLAANARAPNQSFARPPTHSTH